jgi:hypothetical protein
MASLPRPRADKIIAISLNDNVRNDAHVRHLPMHWGTLYELTKLTDEQFDKGIKISERQTMAFLASALTMAIGLTHSVFVPLNGTLGILRRCAKHFRIPVT